MSGWWTAAARAHESQCPDRLFDDPWATVLVGPQVVDMFDRAIASQGAGTRELQAIITRFFDDFLLRVTGTEAIEQVVLVASGLDSRAFRLKWPRETRLFELEQPQVLAYKDSTLASTGATAVCERHAIGVNLKKPWTDSLCRAGFQPFMRSVWLLEGFLCFLAESDVLSLLNSINHLATPGSWLGLDVVNGEMLTSPSTSDWTARMAAAGAPWLFTLDEPEAFLAELGWSAVVVQPGEGTADFGRFPYPLTTRATRGVPRSFLVTATRR